MLLSVVLQVVQGKCEVSEVASFSQNTWVIGQEYFNKSTALLL